MTLWPRGFHASSIVIHTHVYNEVENLVRFKLVHSHTLELVLFTWYIIYMVLIVYAALRHLRLRCSCACAIEPLKPTVAKSLCNNSLDRNQFISSVDSLLTMPINVLLIVILLFLNIMVAGDYVLNSSYLNLHFYPNNNIILIGSEAGIQSNMHAVSSTACLCPGDNLHFECTIVGRGTTLWRGSAFMTCDYIALLHSRFTQGTSGICNSGSLIGRSVEVGNDCYTSQLNITLSRELDEHSIECVHDNGTQLLAIGTSKVKLKGKHHSIKSQITITAGWCIFLSPA